MLTAYRKKLIKWLLLVNHQILLQKNERQEQKNMIKELRGEVSSLNEKLNGIKWIDKNNILGKIVF